MYQIAICDDEECCVEENRQMAAVILAELNVEHQIDCFSTTDRLYAALSAQPNAYQLLLLDIEFSQQNGMELARLLRKEHVQTDIIFITGFDDYVLDGYDVCAVQYLLKPIRKEALKKAIVSAYQKQFNFHPLVFQTRGELKSIPRGEIAYIESFYRRLTLHLRDGGAITFHGAFSMLREQLPAHQFVCCHKSYCVNLDYVRQMRRYESLLTNGMSVPISKGYFERFRKALMEY